MEEYSKAFVAFDTSKAQHAVAIADSGRGAEVRFVGDVASSSAVLEPAGPQAGWPLRQAVFLLRGGPTGYGLYR
jgi:hypothetical protein